MTNLQRVGNIDINEDVPFQRREWKLQRIGWVVIALLLLAGLLGVWGRGPLTTKQITDAASASWVEYHSVDHYQADTTFSLHVGSGAVTADTLRITLNRAYLDRIQLQGIEPEPAAQELRGNGVVYVFDVATPGQPVAVTFEHVFTQPGTATAEIGIEGGPALSFRQFVLP